MRILVADDDRNLNRILCETLREEGCSADGCYNGRDALDFCAGASYDGIVLDVAMPELDGIETVRRLRGRGDQTPVIFLSARGDVQHRVEGLESGGDYYLVKPVDFRELMAVIRAVTRKYAGFRSNLYSVADLTVDIRRRTVKRGGKTIPLTGKEFALLEFLLRNRGVVLTREMIENNLWNYEFEGGTNVVDVYIGYLRRKIDAGFDRKLIHTVWGSGWVLRDEG